MTEDNIPPQPRARGFKAAEYSTCNYRRLGDMKKAVTLQAAANLVVRTVPVLATFRSFPGKPIYCTEETRPLGLAQLVLHFAAGRGFHPASVSAIAATNAANSLIAPTIPRQACRIARGNSA